MEKFIQEQRKKIGLRIQKIIDILGLKPTQFAALTKLTPNTITHISSAKGFNSNTILHISFYTGMPLDVLLDLSSNKIDKKTLVKNFWQNVETHNPSAYNKFKEKRFTIVEAIKKLIEEASFFDKPKKTGEVREYLETEYYKSASSATISQALNNLFEEGLLRRKKIGLRNYAYYK
ncbi:hypothetical protein [Sinomicrobium sp. M5D2P9]